MNSLNPDAECRPEFDAGMSAENLLAHFHRVADSPDAVPRLRRFILDLAARGKLVPQDPEDEPASELLRCAVTEKARLAKAGKINKGKVLIPVADAANPVRDISGWVWVRLGEVATKITKGSTPTSYGHPYTTAGVHFVKVESINNGLLLPKNITSFIAQETHEFLARSRLVAGDILFSIAGSIGTCAVVTKQVLPANTNQALSIIRGTGVVFLPDFLLKLLQASVAQSAVAKARGGAMNNISLNDVQNLIVPLPPLAEQHRIVAKVDELMTLCDRLDAARAERETTRNRLATASLARLNTPDPDPALFRKDVAFALGNLTPLTTRPDQIKALRQTILNLAVRGKLVPQDPNDEPAWDLMRVISTAREELVAADQLKRPKKLWPIAGAEVLYDIPKSWSWVRANDLWDLENGDRGKSYPSRDQLVKEGIPFVNAGHLVDGLVSMSQMNFITAETYEKLNAGKLRKGDQIYCLRGSLGKHAVFDHQCEGAIASSLVILRPIEPQCVPYLFIYLESQVAKQMLQRFDNGSAQPNLSSANLRKFEIPLPPLVEQRRIVSRVDELTALCDRLETSLVTGDDTGGRLLQTTLHEALETGPGVGTR